jgi:tripartite-type tricarboxylate transporter receptor subunit TctC
MSRLVTRAAAALLLVGAAQAAEAPYPNKPIHFVVP